MPVSLVPGLWPGASWSALAWQAGGRGAARPRPRRLGRRRGPACDGSGGEGAPQTVRPWRVEAAAQLRAVAASWLCNGHGTQWPREEWYAGRRGVKEGVRNADNAIKRLERSRLWVGPALDPHSTRLLALARGPRPLALAQMGVPPVVGMGAPGCGPWGLRAGLKEDSTARLRHCGRWGAPARRHATGPRPPPRGMPLPPLLSAQVVQAYRRWRLVGGTPQGVFGARDAMERGRAAWGWPSQTALSARRPRAMRPRVAVRGRRGNTLYQGENGGQHHRAVCHTYHHFLPPPASGRQPWLRPAPPNGTGSATPWRPGTPALVAGLSEHGWS